jgi:hypothetical protein
MYIGYCYSFSRIKPEKTPRFSGFQGTFKGIKIVFLFHFLTEKWQKSQHNKVNSE